MHLSDAESKRFYSLLTLVQTYVISDVSFWMYEEDNDELDISEFERNGLDGARSAELEIPLVSELSESEGLRVCEYAALYPEVLDNIYDRYGSFLDDEDRVVLSQWKNGWYSADAVILAYTDNGDALFQTEMGIVQVSGITQEIAEIMPNVPCIAHTVLMPFEESIVFCGLLSTFPITYGPGIVKTFNDTLEDIREGRQEVIRTPGVYCGRLAEYRVKQREESFNELMRDIEYESLKEHGSVALKGVRRSVLLNLDEEERENAIRQELKSKHLLGDDLALDLALNRAIHHTPRKDLRTAIRDLNREQLEDVAYLLFRRKPPSTVKELIDSIVAACETDFAIRQFLTYSYERQYDFFLKIAENKGRIVIAEDDTDGLRAAQPCPPFTFLYYDENTKEFVGTILGDFVDRLTTDDTISAGESRLRIDDMMHCVDIATGLYGIISVEDFSDLYADYRSWDSDPESILTIVENVLAYQDRDFTVVYIENIPYLVHYAIAPEYFIDDEDFSDLEKDEIVETLAKFWGELLERHKELQRRPFDDVIESEDVQEWVMHLESALLLQQWLDEHVPDEESEYFFSDRVIEDIYMSTWRPFDPNYVPKILFEAYETTLDPATDIPVFNDMLNLAMRFVNDIPRWDNYGYSPTEMRENETGRKIFYNEDGSVKKVGRNDPCPCGSGKKYKKCCGR